MNTNQILSDAELFLLMKQDDPNAFNQLYDRHWLSLYNIAYKRLKDQEACKDIVQDVFADLWHKRQTKEIKDFLPYLHTSIRYKTYSLLSKGQAGPHFIEPFENMAISLLTADQPLIDRENADLIKLLLATLPEKRREIFRQKFIDGISTREISTNLNVSQKTVQNQLLLALQNLRNQLANYLTTLLIIIFSIAK